MGIRFPLQGIVDKSFTGSFGPNSVAGGAAIPFVIPQDTDNIVVKFSASTAGGGVSALLQTTDDGGTTWFDVARTSIVSNAVTSRVQWLSSATNSPGIATAQTYEGASIIAAGIGNAAASTLAQGQINGLPLLSQQARVFVISTGNVNGAASNAVRTQVLVNSQNKGV